jgi:hypothetical protein
MAPAKRRVNPQLAAERSGRQLVAEMREFISACNDELARFRVTRAMPGCRPGRPIDEVILALSNARHRLVTEMQSQPTSVRGSVAVRNCRLALERALATAKALAK